jgi:hypothetical protein
MKQKENLLCVSSLTADASRERDTELAIAPRAARGEFRIVTVSVVTAECESSQYTKVGLARVDSEIGVGRDTGRDSTLGETKNLYAVTSALFTKVKTKKRKVR